jgi:hypothetical protein
LTPMLVDRWAGGDPDRAGRAYALNVVGCIIGPLLEGMERHLLVNGTGITFLTPMTKVMAHLPAGISQPSSEKRAGGVFWHGNYLSLDAFVGHPNHGCGVSA